MAKGKADETDVLACSPADMYRTGPTVQYCTVQYLATSGRTSLVEPGQLAARTFLLAARSEWLVRAVLFDSIHMAGEETIGRRRATDDGGRTTKKGGRRTMLMWRRPKVGELDGRSPSAGGIACFACLRSEPEPHVFYLFHVLDRSPIGVDKEGVSIGPMGSSEPKGLGSIGRKKTELHIFLFFFLVSSSRTS